MPILKRATAKLREAGIERLEVHRHLWGYIVMDPAMRKQRNWCHDSAEEAVQAAIKGERPTIPEG